MCHSACPLFLLKECKEGFHFALDAKTQSWKCHTRGLSYYYFISGRAAAPEFFPLKISKGDYKSLSKNMKSGIMKVAGAGSHTYT